MASDTVGSRNIWDTLDSQTAEAPADPPPQSSLALPPSAPSTLSGSPAFDLRAVSLGKRPASGLITEKSGIRPNLLSGLQKRLKLNSSVLPVPLISTRASSNALHACEHVGVALTSVSTPVATPISTPVKTTPVAAPEASPPAITTPVTTPLVATLPATNPFTAAAVSATSVATPIITPAITTPVATPPVTTPPATAPFTVPAVTSPVITSSIATPPIASPPATAPPLTVPAFATPVAAPPAVSCPLIHAPVITSCALHSFISISHSVQPPVSNAHVVSPPIVPSCVQRLMLPPSPASPRSVYPPPAIRPSIIPSRFVSSPSHLHVLPRCVPPRVARSPVAKLLRPPPPIASLPGALPSVNPSCASPSVTSSLVASPLVTLLPIASPSVASSLVALPHVVSSPVASPPVDASSIALPFIEPLLVPSHLVASPLIVSPYICPPPVVPPPVAPHAVAAPPLAPRPGHPASVGLLSHPPISASFPHTPLAQIPPAKPLPASVSVAVPSIVSPHVCLRSVLRLPAALPPAANVSIISPRVATPPAKARSLASKAIIRLSNISVPVTPPSSVISPLARATTPLVDSTPAVPLRLTSTLVGSVPVTSTAITTFHAISTPITSTSVTSTPIILTPITSTLISATLLNSMPITSTSITSTPITSTPITSARITSTPIASTPINSTSITSTPITSTSITSTPITSTSITSTPITSTSITSTSITSTPITSTSIAPPSDVRRPITAPPEYRPLAFTPYAKPDIPSQAAFPPASPVDCPVSVCNSTSQRSAWDVWNISSVGAPLTNGSASTAKGKELANEVDQSNATKVSQGRPPQPLPSHVTSAVANERKASPVCLYVHSQSNATTNQAGLLDQSGFMGSLISNTKACDSLTSVVATKTDSKPKFHLDFGRVQSRLARLPKSVFCSGKAGGSRHLKGDLHLKEDLDREGRENVLGNAGGSLGNAPSSFRSSLDQGFTEAVVTTISQATKPALPFSRLAGNTAVGPAAAVGITMAVLPPSVVYACRAERNLPCAEVRPLPAVTLDNSPSSTNVRMSAEMCSNVPAESGTVCDVLKGFHSDKLLTADTVCSDEESESDLSSPQPISSLDSVRRVVGPRHKNGVHSLRPEVGSKLTARNRRFGIVHAKTSIRKRRLSSGDHSLPITLKRSALLNCSVNLLEAPRASENLSSNNLDPPPSQACASLKLDPYFFEEGGDASIATVPRFTSLPREKPAISVELSTTEYAPAECMERRAPRSAAVLSRLRCSLLNGSSLDVDSVMAAATFNTSVKIKAGPRMIGLSQGKQPGSTISTRSVLPDAETSGWKSVDSANHCSPKKTESNSSGILKTRPPAGRVKKNRKGYFSRVKDCSVSMAGNQRWQSKMVVPKKEKCFQDSGEPLTKNGDRLDDILGSIDDSVDLLHNGSRVRKDATIAVGNFAEKSHRAAFSGDVDAAKPDWNVLEDCGCFEIQSEFARGVYEKELALATHHASDCFDYDLWTTTRRQRDFVTATPYYSRVAERLGLPPGEIPPTTSDVGRGSRGGKRGGGGKKGQRGGSKTEVGTTREFEWGIEWPGTMSSFRGGGGQRGKGTRHSRGGALTGVGLPSKTVEAELLSPQKNKKMAFYSAFTEHIDKKPAIADYLMLDPTDRKPTWSELLLNLPEYKPDKPAMFYKPDPVKLKQDSAECIPDLGMQGPDMKRFVHEKGGVTGDAKPACSTRGRGLGQRPYRGGHRTLSDKATISSSPLATDDCIETGNCAIGQESTANERRPLKAVILRSNGNLRIISCSDSDSESSPYRASSRAQTGARVVAATCDSDSLDNFHPAGTAGLLRGGGRNLATKAQDSRDFVDSVESRDGDSTGCKDFPKFVNLSLCAGDFMNGGVRVSDRRQTRRSALICDWWSPTSQSARGSMRGGGGLQRGRGGCAPGVGRGVNWSGHKARESHRGAGALRCRAVKLSLTGNFQDNYTLSETAEYCAALENQSEKPTTHGISENLHEVEFIESHWKTNENFSSNSGEKKVGGSPRGKSWKDRDGWGRRPPGGAEGGSECGGGRGGRSKGLLAQLVSSDGYVAGKIAAPPPTNENLFVDSSLLSREERAIQMALMRINEMEVSKEWASARKAKQVSKYCRKANALKKKALARRPNKKAVYLHSSTESTMTKGRPRKVIHISSPPPNKSRKEKPTKPGQLLDKAALNSVLTDDASLRGIIPKRKCLSMKKWRNSKQAEFRTALRGISVRISPIGLARGSEGTFEGCGGEGGQRTRSDADLRRLWARRCVQQHGAERIKRRLKLGEWSKHGSSRTEWDDYRRRKASDWSGIVGAGGGEGGGWDVWGARRNGWGKGGCSVSLEPLSIHIEPMGCGEGEGTSSLLSSVSSSLESIETETASSCGDPELPTAPTRPIIVPREVRRLILSHATGETVLHKAARLGYEDIALWCCRTRYVDVNARDHAGYVPLHETCLGAHVSVARHLLRHGADVNAASRLDGTRPIHEAVMADSLAMVRLLLAAGADVDLTTYSGRTVLDVAQSAVMRDFLRAYLVDLNGATEREAESPWDLAPVWHDVNGGGTGWSGSWDGEGSHLLDNAPADDDPSPPAGSGIPGGMTFELSLKPLLATYPLTRLPSTSRLSGSSNRKKICSTKGFTAELLSSNYINEHRSASSRNFDSQSQSSNFLDSESRSSCELINGQARDDVKETNWKPWNNDETSSAGRLENGEGFSSQLYFDDGDSETLRNSSEITFSQLQIDLDACSSQSQFDFDGCLLQNDGESSSGEILATNLSENDVFRRSEIIEHEDSMIEVYELDNDGSVEVVRLDDLDSIPLDDIFVSTNESQSEMFQIPLGANAASLPHR